MGLGRFFKNDSKTLEGLPVLTEETRLAFTKELEREVVMRKCPASILDEWTEEVGKENPEVIKYIMHVVYNYPPEIQGMSIASLLSLYRLLKSQYINYQILKYFR